MNLTQDQLNVLEAVKLMLIENHPVLVVDGSAGKGSIPLPRRGDCRPRPHRGDH